MSVARQVLALCFLTSALKRFRQCKASDWVQVILTNVGREVVKKIRIVLWALWEHCNKKIFENYNRDPLSIAPFALQLLVQFQGTQVSYLELGGVSGLNRWIAPPMGCLKLNFDAAIFMEVQAAGIGWVAWDCEGMIVHASCRKLEAVTDPLLEEAVAAKEAVLAVLEFYSGKLLLEGDCMQVIKVLLEDDGGFSSLEPILYTIHQRLDNFQDSSVSWVRRCSNSVAHLLARQARIDQFSIWDSVPSFVMHAAMADVSS